MGLVTGNIRARDIHWGWDRNVCSCMISLEIGHDKEWLFTSYAVVAWHAYKEEAWIERTRNNFIKGQQWNMIPKAQCKQKRTIDVIHWDNIGYHIRSISCQFMNAVTRSVIALLQWSYQLLLLTCQLCNPNTDLVRCGWPYLCCLSNLHSSTRVYLICCSLSSDVIYKQMRNCHWSGAV